MIQRPFYHKLTPEQQKIVAEYAAKHGVCRSADTHNVSISAVRRACAITGIPPKRIHGADTKELRIRSAIAFLKHLNLTPQDLLS